MFKKKYFVLLSVKCVSKYQKCRSDLQVWLLFLKENCIYLVQRGDYFLILFSVFLVIERNRENFRKEQFYYFRLGPVLFLIFFFFNNRKYINNIHNI